MEKLIKNNLSMSKHLSSKIELIESTLYQTIYNFRDVVTEMEQIHMVSESVKKQVEAQKEKCESKCCTGSEELKKVIESKENIIQLVASALTKLSETKDFNILTDVFTILFDESKTLDERVKQEKSKDEINSDINIEGMTLLSPKKEPPANMSLEQDVSVSEIEGTPTGRHSPIIQSKKMKSLTNNITPASRDKKKCPQNWVTPEKKSMKVTLTYPTPTRSKGSGRLRQQRIQIVREKPSTVVDLTTMPIFSKGRNSQGEEVLNNIKPEVIENDDTIMPSPTSGPVIPPVFKTIAKESPQKFRKPLALIRTKADKSPTDCKENRPLPDDVTRMSELDNSVSLVKDYPNCYMSPNKCIMRNKSPNQADNSISLLQQQPLHDVDTKVTAQSISPVKRPLAENLNAANVPCDSESSISILRRDLIVKTESLDESIKRTKGQMLEPLYKEPTVRKKAEKRALPGWSCEQCKNFYGELYKDNLEMQAKKMDDCSKHRGRNNPIRPKTPPGYWEPRWNVPEDTEEFNRRNDAV